MPRILIPRKLLQIVRRPIRINLDDGAATGPRMIEFDGSLKLGYGESCDVRLAGDGGPEVICNLERTRGPFRIWTPLGADERRERVDVSVDGHPLEESGRDVRPGSRVEVHDRQSGRTYRLVVEPGPAWLANPRYLAGIVLVLAMAGVLYGAYFYYSLQQATRGLGEVEERMAAQRGEFASAIRKLERAQAASERTVRTEFELGLATVTERTQAELARLSEQDVEARRRLQAEARAEIAALRAELESRMVNAYREFKRIEQHLYESLGAKLAALEPIGPRFKRVLGQARDSVLFIRVSFEMEDARTGEIATQDSFGTGFFVADTGTSMTARHVLYPWLYDRQLQVLVNLDLVRIHEDSVRWSIWTTDERVVVAEDASGTRTFDMDTAWSSDAEDRSVRLLYSPDVEFTRELVDSPIGAVTISVPVAGPDDVAVLQVMRFAEPAPPLAISSREVEPLDEALALGYPLSRLEDGVAAPQGVTGYVRRVSAEVLELDTSLSPGLSGGPILDRDGEVIGMAMSVIHSDVYALAVRARDLRRILERTKAIVADEERRLESIGCDPGEVDGAFDARTWEAIRCEQHRGG